MSPEVINSCERFTTLGAHVRSICCVGGGVVYVEVILLEILLIAQGTSEGLVSSMVLFVILQ